MGDNFDESEVVLGSSLEGEYDDTVSGEDKAKAFLQLTSDAFTRQYAKIKISEIGFSGPIKKARQSTMTGLTATVKDLGVVSPIHVMTLETVGEDDDEDDFKYVLLDGLRRIFSAKRNGLNEIDAIIWDFKDKDKGSDMALFLSLLLNKNQSRKWDEIWHLYTVLELQTPITPGTLEYLLQLESGDAMRLKDVMLCDYADVKEELLTGRKTLDACYKMLQKYRKEEDALAREDVTGLSDTVEGAEEIGGDNSTGGQLSEQDVLELLDMAGDDEDLDATEDDFDTLNKGVDTQQKVGERTPLDPALKSAVLKRDDFKCACCGFGGAAALGVLAVHHILPVHVGGKDSLDNLTTLCLNHHILLHVAERNGGKLQMTTEEFNSYSKEEQKALMKTLKLAKVAVEAAKRKGMSLDTVREETANSIRHPMPGAGLKETKQAFDEAHLK